MTARRAILFTMCAALALPVLAGCDKLTRENFDMIRVDVDNKGDVERLIGEPDDRLLGRWHYERMDKHLEVLVDFDDADIVSRKQWIDADTAEWFDTEEPGDGPVYEKTTIRRINK